MDAIDWRAQLQPDFRKRIVIKIVSKLHMHHPPGDEDELLEIQKIAESFEHKTYAAAASQSDYLRKISLRMLYLEGTWRTQLPPARRQTLVNKIVETLSRHLPSRGQEGLIHIRKIAERFEERIYIAASSQSEYLRRISSKMLTLEAEHQKKMANSMPSNRAR